jgi:hypothetical protein
VSPLLALRDDDDETAADLLRRRSRSLTQLHYIMGFEQNSGVVTKLAIFTVAMVLMPIGTYYLTRDYLFARAYLASAFSHGNFRRRSCFPSHDTTTSVK